MALCQDIITENVSVSAAIPYPARLLSRAVNPLSNKVLQYANAEDSIIVLCDWDGTLAAPACALLSEKGVQNAVLLHGGEPNNSLHRLKRGALRVMLLI